MTAIATRAEASSLEEASRDQVKTVFAQFPSGVVAVSAEIDGKPAGFAASSFAAVSWEPALVSICVQNGSNTWHALRRCPRIGISILSEALAGSVHQLATRNGNRFSGIDTEVLESGAVLIGGASAWMECSVAEEIEAGDHVIVLFRVHRLLTQEDTPLVYHRTLVRHLAS